MTNVDPAIEKSIREAVAQFRESTDVANLLLSWFEEIAANNDDEEVDMQRLALVLDAMDAPAHLTEQVD